MKCSGRGFLGMLLLLAFAGGCARQLTDSEVEALVRTYLDRLTEAYRLGDATRVDDVAGDALARKVLGLVGVRLDRGVTLDSELLGLELEAIVWRGEGVVSVRTREHWRYVERWIGSGEVVEEGSEDHYSMQYRLEKDGDRWWVVQTEFVAPPEIGRELEAWKQGQPVAHGGTTEPEP